MAAKRPRFGGLDVMFNEGAGRADRGVQVPTLAQLAAEAVVAAELFSYHAGRLNLQQTLPPEAFELVMQAAIQMNRPLELVAVFKAWPAHEFRLRRVLPRHVAYTPRLDLWNAALAERLNAGHPWVAVPTSAMDLRRVPTLLLVDVWQNPTVYSQLRQVDLAGVYLGLAELKRLVGISFDQDYKAPQPASPMPLRHVIVDLLVTEESAFDFTSLLRWCRLRAPYETLITFGTLALHAISPAPMAAVLRDLVNFVHFLEEQPASATPALAGLEVSYCFLLPSSHLPHLEALAATATGRQMATLRFRTNYLSASDGTPDEEPQPRQQDHAILYPYLHPIILQLRNLRELDVELTTIPEAGAMKAAGGRNQASLPSLLLDELAQLPQLEAVKLTSTGWRWHQPPPDASAAFLGRTAYIDGADRPITTALSLAGLMATVRGVLVRLAGFSATYSAQLTCLELCRCGLDANMLRILGRAMRGMVALRWLDLSGNRRLFYVTNRDPTSGRPAADEHVVDVAAAFHAALLGSARPRPLVCLRLRDVPIPLELLKRWLELWSGPAGQPCAEHVELSRRLVKVPDSEVDDDSVLYVSQSLQRLARERDVCGPAPTVLFAFEVHLM